MQFLYHRRSRPTGKILGASLGIPHGLTVEDRQRDVLIRWGSRAEPNRDLQYDLVLNSAEAIGAASDKLESLHVMRDAGVNVPDFSTSPLDLEYPFLGRKIQHARGTDIKLILQKKDYRVPSDYYVKYIPTVREYRIHVVRDEVVRVQGKFLDNPRETVAHIRNYQTGYRFRSPRRRLRSERLDASVLAVRSLGLDFGAVDLIIAEDDSHYILEVNTAPSCAPLTASAYALAFARIANIQNLDMDILNMLNPNADEGDTEDETPEDY